MTPIAVALAVAGGAWGLLTDRLSARWPEHEAPFVAGRGIDWRTLAVVAFGACSFGLLGSRFGASIDLVVVGLFMVPLVALLAVDLDQRLLPDVLTLPLAVYAGAIGLAGLNPFAPGGPSGMTGPAVMAVAVPLALYVASLPFGRDAIGMGDLKLLVGVGLMLGFPREIYGLTGSAIVLSIGLLALMAVGRLGRRSYIPFGPFLIVGAVWGILLGG